MEKQGESEKGKKAFWVSDMEAVFAIFIVLLVFGSINVFSSSFVLAETNFGTPYFFLQRQLINLAAGFFCFVLGCRVNYHRWRSWMGLVVSITILALIAVLLVGTEVNGSKRWLGTAGLQIQPAEVAKLVSLMLISAYAAYRVRNDKPIDILFFNPQYMIVLFMGLLIELEPDGGTMFIVVFVPFVLMCIAGLQHTKVLGMGAVFLTAVAALSFLQPYRLARLKILLDPWADAQGIGYQTVQSLSAIGSGGLTGMGLGMGVSKYSYLPEAHTDFAFAIFSQETGFFGVLLMLVLYAAFTVYGARIANAAADAYGQFLATGILLLISGQAMVNLLMVGGLLPVIGVPLPFISYGGTSLMISMASVGILLNIGQHGTGASRSDRMRAELERDVARKKAARLHLVKK
ncbi:FtsW/RodA/SpoVE family cell cycle protein [Selenomonas sputigena]|uniref:Probable peptidoglycan glycosyltransferase FtsW n=1 Tax=Selenomonas sputigena TaxID=69823 RepID=A0ABV3X654_9FIRM